MLTNIPSTTNQNKELSGKLNFSFFFFANVISSINAKIPSENPYEKAEVEAL